MFVITAAQLILSLTFFLRIAFRLPKVNIQNGTCLSPFSYSRDVHKVSSETQERR